MHNYAWLILRVPQDVLFAKRCDVVVEVAHPDVTASVGARVLASGCDFFVGSPTALADRKLWDSLAEASSEFQDPSAAADGTRRPTVFVGTGAFWGADDVRKMADSGALTSLTVTMTKHPLSMKVAPELMVRLHLLKTL
jgi:predicted dinucleotide-utilizing enzyme